MMHSPPQARHIIVNNGKKVNIPPSDPHFILYPYNEKRGLRRNENRIMLQITRPILPGYSKKLGRYCKDKIYLMMAARCAEHQISGSYIGLAANYPGEIFANFYPFVKDQFITYEITKAHFDKLIEYQEFVTTAFPNRECNVDFQVLRSNIIKGLNNSKGAAVIDLDLMGGLGKGRQPSIEDVVLGTKACAAQRCVLTTWQVVGRYGWTDKEMDNEVRPALKKEINKHFKVLHQDKVNYWEGYPMRVDIFTLERKAA